MNKEEVDDVVCEIMQNDGPDGHVDGHEIITDFIMAAKNGNDREWFKKYKERRQ